MGVKAILEKALPTLRVVAPTVAAALGGPVPLAAKVAIDALGAALGVSDPDSETGSAAIAAKVETASAQDLLAIQQAEQSCRIRLEELGVDLERLAVENAGQVNQTMQAEAASQHWPSYSWRPAIGFSVAFNVAFTSLVVGVAFCSVIWFSRDPALLAHIPTMIGAMAALIGVVSPILGIASWFRGRMQADPRVDSDNRG